MQPIPYTNVQLQNNNQPYPVNYSPDNVNMQYQVPMGHPVAPYQNPQQYPYQNPNMMAPQMINPENIVVIFILYDFFIKIKKNSNF